MKYFFNPHCNSVAVGRTPCQVFLGHTHKIPYLIKINENVFITTSKQHVFLPCMLLV